MTSTPLYPDEQIEAARKLFAGPANFVWAAADRDSLMPEGPPEIALVGRSNVGKSSLVNGLTGRKQLARTSITPGRTQELIFFDIGGRFRLVDMPGYGFAAAPKAKIAAWNDLISHYLRGRSTLARLLLLIDARRGIKDVDADVMTMLDKSAVSYQVVLTKSDSVSAAELQKILADTQAKLAKRPAAFPHIAVTSSEKNTGIAELRAGILTLLEERGV